MNTFTQEQWRTARIVALTSLVIAGLAPVVYISVLHVATRLGYDLIRSVLDEFDTNGTGAWAVVPGSVLFSALLCRHLLRANLNRRGHLLRSFFLGILAGALNAPITYALLGVHHNRIGPLDAAASILFVAPMVIALALPVSIPCGALLGLWIGALSQLGLPRDEGAGVRSKRDDNGRPR